MFLRLQTLLPNGRHLLFASVVLSLIVLICISTIQDPKIPSYRYENILEYTGLEDVLRSRLTPPPARAIFFHETTCNHQDSQFHLMNLTARQACAIESAALNNPNLQVFVLFSCPVLRPQPGGPRSLIDAIESYENVHLRQLNLPSYAKGTPIEDWVKKGDLLNSSFPMQHTADLLRLISLYRFGGIYLDMDVVVLRSLENVALNYVGAHDNVTLGNAVIGLESTGKGHEIAELFLRDYQQNFNGKDYVNNGPSLVTRVVQKLCGIRVVKAIQEGRKSCQGFKVFDSNAFYALPWPQWQQFIEPKYLEDTMAKTKDSYLIHLWNKASYRGRMKVGSNAAYGKYAEKHCPKAYAAAGEFF